MCVNPLLQNNDYCSFLSSEVRVDKYQIQHAYSNNFGNIIQNENHLFFRYFTFGYKNFNCRTIMKQNTKDGDFFDAVR